MIAPVNLEICLQNGVFQAELPGHIVFYPYSIGLREFVLARIPERIFAIIRITVLTERRLPPIRGVPMATKLRTPIVKCTYKFLSSDKKYTDRAKIKNYLPINGEIPSRSKFSDWKYSLYIFCTAFFKILSNEIREKNVPEHLRLRAVVCMVVVPTVAFMGLLMPFASCYFNRIVCKLNFWMIDFDSDNKAPADDDKVSAFDNDMRASANANRAYADDDINFDEFDEDFDNIDVDDDIRASLAKNKRLFIPIASCADTKVPPFKISINSGVSDKYLRIFFDYAIKEKELMFQYTRNTDRILRHYNVIAEYRD